MKVNLGYGIWESFHTGLDFRFNNYSLGFDIGTSFGTKPFEDKYYSLTLDNTFHWGKNYKLDKKTWYTDIRLIYWTSIEPSITWRVFQICPSIGRDFYLSEKFGLNLDLGPAILLFGSKENKDVEVGWLYPVYPEIRFELFYIF